jgi:hypothetical protein
MEDTGRRYSQLHASTSTMAQVELRFDWRMSPHILRARASHPHADALHFLGSRASRPRADVPHFLGARASRPHCSPHPGSADVSPALPPTSCERGRLARIAPHFLGSRASRPHCSPHPGSADVSPALPPTSCERGRLARIAPHFLGSRASRPRADAPHFLGSRASRPRADAPASWLSRVDFLGEMSGFLHSGASLPLIPLPPSPTRGEGGFWAS